MCKLLAAAVEVLKSVNAPVNLSLPSNWYGASGHIGHVSIYAFEYVNRCALRPREGGRGGERRGRSRLREGARGRKSERASVLSEV